MILDAARITSPQIVQNFTIESPMVGQLVSTSLEIDP